MQQGLAKFFYGVNIVNVLRSNPRCVQFDGCGHPAHIYSNLVLTITHATYLPFISRCLSIITLQYIPQRRHLVVLSPSRLELENIRRIAVTPTLGSCRGSSSGPSQLSPNVVYDEIHTDPSTSCQSIVRYFVVVLEDSIWAAT